MTAKARLPAVYPSALQIAQVLRVVADGQSNKGGIWNNTPGYEPTPSEWAYEAINETLVRLADTFEELARNGGGHFSSECQKIKERKERGY